MINSAIRALREALGPPRRPGEFVEERDVVGAIRLLAHHFVDLVSIRPDENAPAIGLDAVEDDGRGLCRAGQPRRENTTLANQPTTVNPSSSEPSRLHRRAADHNRGDPRSPPSLGIDHIDMPATPSGCVARAVRRRGRADDQIWAEETWWYREAERATSMETQNLVRLLDRLGPSDSNVGRGMSALAIQTGLMRRD